jgi:putative transposase
MKRIPPSVRMKEEVTALLKGEAVGNSTEAPMEDFARATARYMLQIAIEAEATAFLGRDHHRRGKRMRADWRNGYEPKGVQTAATTSCAQPAVA